MTAGVAKQLGIGVRRLQARQSRRRVLQHVGVRPRGTARALRRARPALPGGGRARVRGGPGARRQHAAVHPLRDDRHRQRDALGGRVPRRAVPPAPHRRGPGAVDVAARRRRDALVRRAARRRRGRSAPPARRRPARASTRATACTERIDELDPDRGGRGGAVRGSVSRRSALPELVDDARFADRAAPARAPPPARGTLRAGVRDADGHRLVTPARRRRRAERDPAATRTPARPSSSTPTTNGSGSSPSTSTRSSAACGSSARSSTSRRRPAGSRARRRSSASTPRTSWAGSATTTRQMQALKDEGVVYWPDDAYSWTV